MDGAQLYGFITVFGTIGVVVVCLILYARVMSRRHFKCPYCGQRFKANPLKTFFSSSQGLDKLMVCPGCGKSGYMEYMHDEDFTPEMERKELEEHRERQAKEDREAED